MKRKGLIIPSSTIISDSGNSTNIGGGIDPALIRNWVMFWDEFICPDNNFISTGLPPDLDFLQQKELLTRNEIESHFQVVFLAVISVSYFLLHKK
jgi:hypothetical protein